MLTRMHRRLLVYVKLKGAIVNALGTYACMILVIENSNK